MNYGLYLSATGIMTASHQIDVIANNLANADTGGFKRQLAVMQERSPEAVEDPFNAGGDRFFDTVGGGQLLAPSHFDQSAGELEQTDGNLDLAIRGEGYFLVRDAKGQERLTRNGGMLADHEGNLVLATDPSARVLDADRQPIKFDPSTSSGDIEIGTDATMYRNGEPLGKIGLFNVANQNLLRPVGGTLLKAPASLKIDAINGQVEPGFVERSNVDPTTELTRMMEAQRMLEANANLIRYQDTSMGRLVTDVGRIA